MAKPDENKNGENAYETAAQEEASTPQETIDSVAEDGMVDEANQNEMVAEIDPEQESAAVDEKSKRSHVWERWLLILVAGIVIALDQYSKSLVEAALELYTYWAPFPGLEHIFRITHISNTGVAFGLFQNGNTIFTILAIIVSIAIVIYNARLEGGHKLLRLALGLQMGGALGNMIDRIRLGYVTDFMDFGPWPVWNFADLAIVSGTILLVLIMFHEERQEKRLAEDAAVADDQFTTTLETTPPHVDESPTS